MLAPNRIRRTLTSDGRVLLLYLFLALVLTYPLVLHVSTHVSGQGVDDPAQTWSLWWAKYSIVDLGVSPLSTDYLFYPVGINLAAYTPTLLNGILSVPLQFAFGVIVAQNLVLFFSLVGACRARDCRRTARRRRRQACPKAQSWRPTFSTPTDWSPTRTANRARST